MSAARATAGTNLTDLPTDILYIIFPYLDPEEFLALCSTNKALWSLHEDSNYWHTLTRSTFRLPSQPLLQADGARWQWLYKTLATQTRVYTWGHNDYDCLGHSPRRWETLPGHRQRVLRPTNVAWPTELSDVSYDNIGVVVDVQCGGWSTTIMNSRGALFCCGRLDGLHLRRTDLPEKRGLQPLLFPPGYPHPKDRYDPVTAIAQFSSGRSNILGLSDSGVIWLWANLADPGVHITFLHLDLPPQIDKHQTSVRELNGKKRVKKVVAGWDRMSAYVSGIGIVLWLPRKGSLSQSTTATEATDGLQLDVDNTVPDTWYRRPIGNARDPSTEAKQLGEAVGQVMNYILLESYVVIVTDLGKVFAANTANQSKVSQGLVELTTLAPDSTGTAMTFSDVQGSFRSFAAFTKDGKIAIGNRNYLDYSWNVRFGDVGSEAVALQLPKYYPALQQQDIISVAFGDYHMHALHLNGHISSLGVEPQSCGALGLGTHLDGGWLRGVSFSPRAPFNDNLGGDRSIAPEKFSRGHCIWFEQEKKDWLYYMSKGGSLEKQNWDEVYSQWCRASPEAQEELTEWFEQMGADWDKCPDVAGEANAGFGAYSALSIAAAGWHSASLVLVNDQLVRKIENKFTKPEPDVADSRRSSLLGSAFGWLFHFGRRFLGIERAGNDYSRDNTPPEPDTEQKKYTWCNDPFPRIKLSTGEVIGREGPLWEKKNGVFAIVGAT